MYYSARRAVSVLLLVSIFDCLSSIWSEKNTEGKENASHSAYRSVCLGWRWVNIKLASCNC